MWIYVGNVKKKYGDILPSSIDFRLSCEILGVNCWNPIIIPKEILQLDIADYEDEKVVSSIIFVEDNQALASSPMEYKDKITEDFLEGIY